MFGEIEPSFFNDIAHDVAAAKTPAQQRIAFVRSLLMDAGRGEHPDEVAKWMSDAAAELKLKLPPGWDAPLQPEPAKSKARAVKTKAKGRGKK
jgi:hypothetical protein